jgi:hypothetical protein
VIPKVTPPKVSPPKVLPPKVLPPKATPPKVLPPKVLPPKVISKSVDSSIKNALETSQPSPKIITSKVIPKATEVPKKIDNVKEALVTSQSSPKLVSSQSVSSQSVSSQSVSSQSVSSQSAKPITSVKEIPKIDSKLSKAFETSSKSSTPTTPKRSVSDYQKASEMAKTISKSPVANVVTKQVPKETIKFTGKLVKIRTVSVGATTPKVKLSDNKAKLLKDQYGLDVMEKDYYDKNEFLKAIETQMNNNKITTLPNGIIRNKEGKLDVKPEWVNKNDRRMFILTGGSKEYKKYLNELVNLEKEISKLKK